MTTKQKTVVVTGASQGSGAAVANLPLGQIPAARDIAEAVFYLTEASQVTGEVLHVDGGMDLGRW